MIELSLVNSSFETAEQFNDEMFNINPKNAQVHITCIPPSLLKVEEIELVACKYINAFLERTEVYPVTNLDINSETMADGRKVILHIIFQIAWD